MRVSQRRPHSMQAPYMFSSEKQKWQRTHKGEVSRDGTQSTGMLLNSAYDITATSRNLSTIREEVAVTCIEKSNIWSITQCSEKPHTQTPFAEGQTVCIVGSMEGNSLAYHFPAVLPSQHTVRGICYCVEKLRNGSAVSPWQCNGTENISSADVVILHHTLYCIRRC